ncbi:MAG: amidohydrolase family protein, partial [Chromatocurvus sp.]
MRAALVLVILTCASGALHGAEPADRIFFNARFYTVEPTRPTAGAVAVKDGRFVYVGDASGARDWAGPHTQRVDLGGAMAMPGLVDAHVHAQRAGVKTLFECNFPFSATPEQIAERVRTCVAENPDALWVRGGQWDSGFFERYDIPSPRAFLDAISGDKAVLLNDDSYHNGWANSRALALAGITADTPDPADDTIVRDPETGEPNGLLLEGAEQAMYEQLPSWSAAQQRAGAREAMRIANRLGFTGFKEAAATEAEIAAFHALDSEDAMTAHVATALRTPGGDAAATFDYAWIDRVLEQYSGRRLHTGFVKIFMDGVPTPARTAAMLDPYLPDAEGRRSRGMLHLPESRLSREMIELDRRGYTVKIHTAGDRAV